MKLEVVLEPSEEGGLTVYVPSLPGCISEGDSEGQTLQNIREAIELYLEPMDDDLAGVGKDVRVIVLCASFRAYLFDRIVKRYKAPGLSLLEARKSYSIAETNNGRCSGNYCSRPSTGKTRHSLSILKAAQLSVDNLTRCCSNSTQPVERARFF